MAIRQVATAAKPAEPAPGHNAPPASAADALRQRLAEGNAALIQRKEDLLAAADRTPAEIADEDTAGRISDFILQLGAAYKAVEKVRVAEKEVFLEGGRTVDGFFKSVTDPLLTAKKTIEARLTAYQRRKADEERRRREEEARRAREEEERKAREAAERAAAAQTDADLDAAIAAEEEAKRKAEEAQRAAEAAAAKPAELSRSRGDYGAVASLRTTWTYEVADETQIPRQFLMVNDAAIKAHIKNRAKDQPPSNIAGIRFIEQHHSVVR